LHLASLLQPQVERQIEQMVKFIRQEAEEKSNEIKVSAEEVSAMRA
jgi:vacuolar-type H+-ATPase subunit E/Vma4